MEINFIAVIEERDDILYDFFSSLRDAEAWVSVQTLPNAGRKEIIFVSKNSVHPSLPEKVLAVLATSRSGGKKRPKDPIS